MNKLIKVLPVIPFALMLGGFGVVLLAKPTGESSVSENRKLQQRPELLGKKLLTGEFQKQYEAFLSDQFVDRAGFVNLKTQIGIALGQRELNNVYIGTDGYLIEKYSEEDFDERQVDENIGCLADFLDGQIEKLGREHVCALFVPSKCNVLQERLPAHAPVYDSSYVANRLRERITERGGCQNPLVLDLQDTLLAHQEEPVYYRTDHHWTTLGAFYAYGRYRQLKGEKAPEVSAYAREKVTEDFYGTTFDKVQIKLKADAIERWMPKNPTSVSVDFNDGSEVWDTFYYKDALSEKDKYQFFFGGNEAKIHIHTGSGNGRCLLLLKDSYSNCLAEFLAEDYQDINMIDLRYTSRNIYDMMERILDEQKITDVLVVYNREKFMKDNNLSQLENDNEDEAGGGSGKKADSGKGNTAENEDGEDSEQGTGSETEEPVDTEEEGNIF